MKLKGANRRSFAPCSVVPVLDGFFFLPPFFHAPLFLRLLQHSSAPLLRPLFLPQQPEEHGGDVACSWEVVEGS